MENDRRPSGIWATSSSPTARSSIYGHFIPTYQHQSPQDALGISREYSVSPNKTRKEADPFHPAQNLGDKDSLANGSDASAPSRLLLRRLSLNMSKEALNSMLLFASDLINAEFVHSRHPEEQDYQTAVATFATFDGAVEVRSRLNGKSNASGDSTMIVEFLKGPSSPTQDTLQRRMSDAQARLSISTSSGSSHGRPSRFSNQFQAMDPKLSPSKGPRALGSLDLTTINGNPGLQTMLSPTSPIRTSSDRTRVSSRSIIGDDLTDEETREILHSPGAFAESNHRARGGGSRQLASQFGNLRLDTNGDGEDAPYANGHAMISPGSAFTSARSTLQNLKSPNTDYSSSFGFSPSSPNESFSPHYPRHQLPPVNPADQNPPCNTLYVGNLPIDTSEDELKAVFSKQRGYKRLCFRTKHNGPMCFVEFEDVSFATKALKELYGHMLHNSVKGGIRLSFSKNPLGVRKDQMSMHSPMSPIGSGFGGFGGSAFSTASGPPPGLSMPPGLSPSMNGGAANSQDSFHAAQSSPQHSMSHHDIFQGQLTNAYMISARGFPSMGSTFAESNGRR